MAPAASTLFSLPRVSLRTRLTVWVLAIFAAIQIVTGFGLWFYQRQATIDLFETRLRERAESVAQELQAQLPNLTPDEVDAVARYELGQIQFTLFEVDVIDDRGRSVVYPTVRWPGAVPDLAAEAIATGIPARGRIPPELVSIEISDGEHAEALAIPITGPLSERLALVVVTSDRYVVQQLRLTGRLLIAAGMLGMLASAISGWFIAGLAVDPFQRLAELAERLSPENLDREFIVESSTTEVGELTRELDDVRERLRKAFAAQERFLSNISHEIKTPIATLLTEAQTIDRSTLGPDALDFVEVTEDEMRKLGRLVESFLTLTRVREGSGVKRPRRYPANELVMDAVEDCQQMAEQYAIRLVPTLAFDEEAMEASIVGDPQLLRTMLNNLVRNAIRFSPRDARVTVAAMLKGGTFSVAIEDEGPGLPTDGLSRLFDRFVQAGDEARRERGHGLGLAIAKGIAELHRGDIVAENRGEGGARFILTLPVRAPAENGDALPARSELDRPAAARQQQ